MCAVLADGFLSRCDTRAVHQTHQFPHGHGFGDDGLSVGFFADVAGDKSAAYVFGHGLAFFNLHIGNHHMCTLMR